MLSNYEYYIMMWRKVTLVLCYRNLLREDNLKKVHFYCLLLRRWGYVWPKKKEKSAVWSVMQE